ncbi:hypothetical protein J6590_018575 [Homalodisca vitripennis]|nr:hypothetical protein J6590_018575 [Homalodisca vitripennis]
MNMKQSHLKKIKLEDCSSKVLPKIKDLKIIDKEIAKTRRKLMDFQNQRAKRNASLANNILTLEKEKEQITNCPVVINLDEDQTMHYFNLHVDHLEDNSGLQRGRQKTWKPFEVKPPPVINVITILKEIDSRATSMKHNEEKLRLLEMCDLKPIQVKGKSLEVPASDSPRPKQEIISIVPNNSPALLVRDSPTKFNEDPNLSNREEIARKVVEKWRLFVKNKRTFELEERKRMKLKLLKYYFALWRLNVKQGKASKLKQVNTETEKCSKQNRTIEINKAQTISNGIQNHVKTLKNQCDENKKKDSVLSENPLFIITQNHPSQENNLKPIRNNPVKSKVNVRMVKPEDVGLVEKMKEKTRLHNGNVTKEKALTTETISKICKEPFENRFLAQQKIIENQMAVIEKQRKTILELKAEHWETKSKLNLKLAENEMAKAHAAFGKKHAPSINTIERNAPLKEAIIPGEKIKNKTDLLMERWMERQAYCKQLSESTKMRKKRIEEEKEKEKIEQQEKEKKEKEEQKRLNILMKIREKQLAKEKERIDRNSKLLTAELNEMAKQHYNNVLIKKVFKAFKKFSSDLHSMANSCTQMYERKLMGKALAAWVFETKTSALIKNQLADNYYYTKLIKKCWNIWLGVRSKIHIISKL